MHFFLVAHMAGGGCTGGGGGDCASPLGTPLGTGISRCLAAALLSTRQSLAHPSALQVHLRTHSGRNRTAARSVTSLLPSHLRCNDI